MTTDYREIYDDIIERQVNYNRAENSPGFRACLLAAERIHSVTGPALDVGCGVGFALELLGGPLFGLDAWGIDVSEVAVARARERIGSDQVLQFDGQSIPFTEDHFGMVTCFDVLEHLEEGDAGELLREMRRVLRPGGLLFCTISCRPAGSMDKFGMNLHRTVKNPQWWIDLVDPDEALIRFREAEVLFWKYEPKAQ